MTRVLYRKTGGEKRFVIVDAANERLDPPVLYESFHFIWPAKPQAATCQRRETRTRDRSKEKSSMSSVRVCESGDFLAQNRPLPQSNAAICWPCLPRGATVA